jgi:hypothetical protein
MEHEQVRLSAGEVRELQRIEAELGMLDSNDDGFATVRSTRVGLRKRMAVAALVLVGSAALVVGTFAMSLALAAAGYVAMLVSAVTFTDALVMDRRCRHAERGGPLPEDGSDER